MDNTDTVTDIYSAFDYITRRTVDFISTDQMFASSSKFTLNQIMILIAEYKSDFNLCLKYRMDLKSELSVLVEALETLENRILACTDKALFQTLNPIEKNIFQKRFELIVKMFKKWFIDHNKSDLQTETAIMSDDEFNTLRPE